MRKGDWEGYAPSRRLGDAVPIQDVFFHLTEEAQLLFEAAWRSEGRKRVGARAPMKLPTNPVVAARHGTVTGYATRGCRCALCTKAMSEYSRGYRERKRARQSADGLPESFGEVGA